MVALVGTAMAFSSVLCTSLIILYAALIGADDPYHVLQNTDITPCAAPCIRVGNCGYDTPHPVCELPDTYTHARLPSISYLLPAIP